ncbi:HXXXD-type acyl-transferase family protein [Striga hermonthica]|uniref:HXXXD-type acyl-transferase family protein n=1 Tax=Striga hermonthica TaxID=68872 RepID=A0A9N7MUL4_STRHE|nr:HXXXD-type acyl-transferase family protein [Striga hermonthica]
MMLWRSFLGFPVDAQARLDPPVLENYFGNCLDKGLVIIERRRLVGENGFVIEVEAIADPIKNRVNVNNVVLRGAENWLSEIRKLRGMRVFSVSASLKFSFSDVDFGWAKSRKFEIVSVDGEMYSMSLCKSIVSDGGLEIELSLPRGRMEAFGAIFGKGIDGSSRRFLSRVSTVARL